MKRHPCNHCHQSGLSVIGRAVAEGREERRDFARGELFCRRCGGRGYTGGVSEWLIAVVVVVVAVCVIVGFWLAVIAGVDALLR